MGARVDPTIRPQVVEVVVCCFGDEEGPDVGVGDCPVVGAKFGEAKVYYVGEAEIPGAGVGSTPVTNSTVNTLFYFGPHYRYISNKRTKAFSVGHISHNNISDSGA